MRAFPGYKLTVAWGVGMLAQYRALTRRATGFFSRDHHVPFGLYVCCLVSLRHNELSGDSQGRRA